MSATEQNVTVHKNPNLEIVDPEAEPEEILRKYWVTVFFSAECELDLETRIRLKFEGFTPNNNLPRCYNFRTYRPGEAREKARYARKYIKINNPHPCTITTTVTVQPQCKACLRFLPFQTKETCIFCGGPILKKGFMDIGTGRVYFLKKEGGRNK